MLVMPQSKFSVPAASVFISRSAQLSADFTDLSVSIFALTTCCNHKVRTPKALTFPTPLASADPAATDLGQTVSSQPVQPVQASTTSGQSQLGQCKEGQQEWNKQCSPCLLVSRRSATCSQKHGSCLFGDSLGFKFQGSGSWVPGFQDSRVPEFCGLSCPLPPSPPPQVPGSEGPRTRRVPAPAAQQCQYSPCLCEGVAGRRRLHTNTAYAHLRGFNRPSS